MKIFASQIYYYILYEYLYFGFKFFFTLKSQDYFSFSKLVDFSLEQFKNNSSNNYNVFNSLIFLIKNTRRIQKNLFTFVSI